MPDGSDLAIPRFAPENLTIEQKQSHRIAEQAGNFQIVEQITMEYIHTHCCFYLPHAW